MTLLHWSLLPLAALAIVPILLHLLTLHRLRTVELSTYRFLFDTYVQQRRQMKFLEALLAFLRTLFLLALVLMFCRPVVRHWDRIFGAGSGREVVILLDTSASMNARTQGRSSLDRAKAAVLAIAGQLGKDDRLTLVRVSARPSEVFGRYGSDDEAIREKVEAIECSPARANLFAALSQVFAGERAHDRLPETYVISDGQSCSWRELREQGLDRLVPAGARVTVVDVGSNEVFANRGIIGDAPRREVAVLGLPVKLRPRVVNHSRSETADMTVGFFVDDKQAARIPFTLRPDESAGKEIIYTPTDAGTLRCRFEIGADQFPDDDSFLFILHVVPQLKVLLVNGYQAADPFESEALYLRTALGATSEPEQPERKPTAVNLGPSQEFVRSLDVREIPEWQVNTESLHDAGVVILMNCGGLNGDQYQMIREHVRGGGGLLIFPGDKVNAEAYSRHFFPIAGQPGESLTGVLLGPPQGDRSNRATLFRLASVDFSHPALSVFDDPERHYLTTASFYRAFEIRPTEPRLSSWPLARFTSGAPALVESHFGTGIAVLAAFPATTKWSNLPLKPEFVPLVLRLVSYVTQAPDLVVPSTAPADAGAEIAVAGAWSPAMARVIDPKGQSSPVELERSASRLMGQFDTTGRKGYYTVEARGGRPEPPQAAASAFAVNTAAEETNFQKLSEDEIRECLPTASLTFVNASADAEQAHGALGEEREIWRPLIIIVFAIIGVEFLLATMSSHAPAGPPRALRQRIGDLSPGAWVGRMTGAERLAD
jgi:hypothetical protein